MIAMDTKDYDEELEKRMKALAPNKCCSILYTVMIMVLVEVLVVFIFPIRLIVRYHW